MRVEFVALLACTVLGLAGALLLVVLGCPGERRRVLFGRRRSALWRFLVGDMSMRRTLCLGGPATLGLAWWGCAMGFVPAPLWGQGAVAVWSGGWALALLNAARKSRLSLGRSFAVCLIVATLGLHMGAALVGIIDGIMTGCL
ncbi:hypothetical protein I5M86_00085 [Serratia marcescens]|nr:hypothetical protein [Serratia marcescens]MBH3063781.1 hypothetical protein [Serratia marcescens]